MLFSFLFFFFLQMLKVLLFCCQLPNCAKTTPSGYKKSYIFFVFEIVHTICMRVEDVMGKISVE